MVDKQAAGLPGLRASGFGSESTEYQYVCVVSECQDVVIRMLRMPAVPGTGHPAGSSGSLVIHCVGFDGGQSAAPWHVCALCFWWQPRSCRQGTVPGPTLVTVLERI